jgi:3-deoxy-manno-octulosonate cytidylyltransferase (CMP-KDO synthetase)
MIHIIGVIPARYASTRFPGKPLIDIGGKSMIQRVYEQCVKTSVLSDVIVATDDQRIADHVVAFGGKVMMTAVTHQSGTDRCIEAFEKTGLNCTHFINVQGDEPLISAKQIDALAKSLSKEKASIATLIKKNDSWEDFQNTHRVKVVIDLGGKALYFSRSPIPFQEKQNFSYFWKHIGMYGFDAKLLPRLQSLSVSSLEKQESLEQLRWLENGIPIQTTETELETPSVDTPADLDKILMYFPE